jgi:PAS domain S-box-containing protein
MPPVEHTPDFTTLLFERAMGGLLLTAVCAILYAYRRRAYFLDWTLAVFSAVLWSVSAGVALRIADDEPEPPARVGALLLVAALFGVWHCVLWLAGLLRYRSLQHKTFQFAADVAATASASSLPWQATLYGLVVSAMIGLPLLAVAPWKARAALVLGLAGLVFTGSAAWFAARRSPSKAASILVPLLLGIYGLAHLYGAAQTWSLAWESTKSAVVATAPLDSIYLALAVVGIIVLLLDEEDQLRRGTIEQLRESEDRLRLIVDYGGVGLVLLSPDGFFLHSNPAFTNLLGYSPEELHGRALADLTHPDDRTGTYSVNKSPETLHEREKRFTHKDGRKVWARVIRVPVRGPGNSVRCHAAVLVDVTERRHAERALAESEQRLRLRLEQAFDGISVWSAAGTFLDANPALCRLLGRERAELVGKAAGAFAYAPDLMRGHLERTLAAGADRCELPLRGRGGEAIEVEVISALVEVDGQRLVQGICRDITDRKKAEEALRQAERRLREERDFREQILQTAEALILVLDTSGQILRMNAKAQAVSGYTEEEARGRKTYEILLPDRLTGLGQAFVEHFVRGGIPTPPPGWQIPADVLFCDGMQSEGLIEAPIRVRDGGERRIAWRVALLRQEEAGRGFIICVGLDVTEQRALEERTAQSRKMETLTALVGGIAHDFNNQLTAIVGNLGLALTDLRQEEASPQSAPLVRELLPVLADAELAAQQCAGMTARLLVFSRGTGGPRRPVDLALVVGEAARLLQHEFPSSIRVRVQVPSEVHPVEADVSQLHEMLLHLASNARDAMPDGGNLTLCVVNHGSAPGPARGFPDQPGPFVELRVEDTGAGMTPEVRERAFEPLFSTKGAGRGMGLAIVFGIVRGHLGRITLDSRPGLGTTWRVFFPAAREAGRLAELGDEALRTPGEGEPAAATAVSLTDTEFASAGKRVGRECILVVDDEAQVRSLARAILTREGFQVLLAADGEEALALYRARGSSIDLVLLDYTMPNLTGLQVMQQLREFAPDARVVLSSGYALENEISQFLEFGGKAFIPKPYRPRDLIQTIRRILEEPQAT